MGGDTSRVAAMVDGQVITVNPRTWSISNVEIGTTESAEDGAVGVVPGLGDTQRVDVTVTTKFNHIIKLIWQ